MESKTLRYKVKEENKRKLKVFLKKIENGKSRVGKGSRK